MKKKIKLWGKSLLIVFDKEDIDIYGLVEGDPIKINGMRWEKKIKLWGNSFVVVFDKKDIDLYRLVEGSILDINEMLWEKKIKSKKVKDGI